MSDQLASMGTLSAFIILIILTVAVFFALKKTSDKQTVDQFIRGLGEKILEIVLETIGDIDPNNFMSFDQFSKTVIEKTYSAVWDYVSFTAQEELEDNNITKAVFKLIDKDKVVEFLDNLYESENINQLIQDAYGRVKIKKLIDDPEDAQLQEEYSNQELYVEDASEFELPPAEEKAIPEEELSKIIPPVEEEDENLDLEDDSVELIVDKKEIIRANDKNGNILYYEVDADGKKTRVSKEYAEQNSGE